MLLLTLFLTSLAFAEPECKDKVDELRGVLYDDEATCATAIESFGDSICTNGHFYPYCCATCSVKKDEVEVGHGGIMASGSLSFGGSSAPAKKGLGKKCSGTYECVDGAHCGYMSNICEPYGNQWYGGWCETSPGVDANDWTDAIQATDRDDCLRKCKSKPYWGCEYYGPRHGCIRHNTKITMAHTGGDGFQCYIRSYNNYDPKPKEGVDYNKAVKEMDDQKGWCVGESHRVNMPVKYQTRHSCLEACQAERWNGQMPTACEWSDHYDSCASFWGSGVRATHQGSNYRCNIAKKSAGETAGVFMKEDTTVGFEEFVTYGFAAVGLGALLYGARKHFLREKVTPSHEDEL